jgi:sugar phosphate isomerase/epimerase
MSIEIGVNMEFIRCEDKPFAAGVERAKEIGFKYVEPMLHNGRELLSEAGYFHSFSMDEDPLEMKEVLERIGIKASGVSAHTPLMRPEISVPYLQKAIRFVAAMGPDVCDPIVNTDEGIRPDWMEDDHCFQVMQYTLTMACKTAERYGISIGIEPHQSISKTTEGLLKIGGLVDSPALLFNYDMGNAYLGGAEPYEGLKATGDRLVHVHAKDIAIEMADESRGKVTGTPVGCACGDGVIDWKKTIEILKEMNFSGVLSVECGTPEQAERSLAHLKSFL